MFTQKINKWHLATLITLLFPVTSFSQEFIEGDVSAGEELYISQCQACHGRAGNSLVPEQPVIAGQHAEYIVAQTKLFRNKERINVAMDPFVENLSDADINNIAVYLEAQNAGLSGAVDEELVAWGENIYRNGIAERNIPNCTGCHGPSGKGIPPLYPRLSGQHATYTAKTLTEFRDGVRAHDTMSAVVVGLTNEEISALAEYISGLY